MIDNTTGYSNVATGVRALYHNTSRSNLVAIGDSALYNNGLGATDPWQASRNTAIGSKAMYNNTTGHRNTASGWQALYSSTTGYGNTAMGFQALYSSTTGSQNVAIGWRAGYYLVGGNDNIFIGSSSGPTSPQSIDSSMWLGITGENEPVLYGDLTDGRIGIGATSPHPSAKLEVNSTDKGFLPPRMTKNQRTAIASPAAGLLVFQTDVSSGYYYYTGTNWVGLEGSGAGATSSSSCIDYDGNAYPTFTIGTQVWMAENLRVTHYRNGDAIPNVTGDGAWAALTTGAYCWYDNDQSTNAKYGALYNWYAVDDTRGLCPAGWHEPTDAEWTAFTTYLGGESVAGGKMKSVSALWNSPNTDATNSSRFSGLPGGGRSSSGYFDVIGFYGHWWTSSEIDIYYAWVRTLFYYGPEVYRLNYDKVLGFSVRCLRDE
ncbi:MAG TPA: fibrobacter succinogenes major paralogous domain-containing protein [Bacteroidales bacterium]|nr:fibrobacter succinogenes major paralogous domain-containing protein [Bacteroidales bacterium]